MVEYHPFTISSAPSDGELTFHVKSMGEGKFSGRLLSLVAQEGEDSDGGAALTVSVDGPHGLTIEHEKYRSILFVAGGIGVTPCLACFRHLRKLCAAQQWRCANVKLLWVAKTTSLFDVFSAQLAEATAAPASGEEGQFAVELYSTQGEVSLGGHPVAPGRPDLAGAIDAISTGDEPACSCLVFACGPAGMVAAARSRAVERGCHFHAESFEL